MLPISRPTATDSRLLRLVYSPWAAATVLLLAVLVRLLCLHGPYSSLRHGSANYHAAAAVGLMTGEGPTYSIPQYRDIMASVDNLSGDYLALPAVAERHPFIEFLPGPSYLLAALWFLSGSNNFGPLLHLQVILDGLALAAIFLALRPRHPWLALAIGVTMCINPAVVRNTLTAGYDFWPYFSAIVLFSAVLHGLQARDFRPWLVGGGLVVAWSGWCRETSVVLPFFLAVAFIWHEWRRGGGLRRGIGAAATLLAPVLLSLLVLSAVRHSQTGSARPTRAIFWHTAAAGIAQFPNPYGLEHDDRSVSRWAVALEPRLAEQSRMEWEHSPDSLYEETLKQAVMGIVRDNPLLVARNTLIRMLFVLSPTLNADADYIPHALRAFAIPVGIVLLVLWGLGARALYREDHLLCSLAFTGVLSVVVAFSWLYVIGRVVLPVLVLNSVLWFSGLGAVLQLIGSYAARSKTWS